jgi:hypothetical protein
VGGSPLLCGRVIGVILREEDQHRRTQIVSNFIRVAENLLELQNFNGVMQIIASLSKTEVVRLKVRRPRWWCVRVCVCVWCGLVVWCVYGGGGVGVGVCVCVRVYVCVCVAWLGACVVLVVCCVCGGVV